MSVSTDDQTITILKLELAKIEVMLARSQLALVQAEARAQQAHVLLDIALSIKDANYRSPINVIKDNCQSVKSQRLS